MRRQFGKINLSIIKKEERGFKPLNNVLTFAIFSALLVYVKNDAFMMHLVM